MDTKTIEQWLEEVNEENLSKFTEEDVRTDKNGEAYVVTQDEDGLLFREYFNKEYGLSLK